MKGFADGTTFARSRRINSHPRKLNFICCASTISRHYCAQFLHSRSQSFLSCLSFLPDDVYAAGCGVIRSLCNNFYGPKSSQNYRRSPSWGPHTAGDRQRERPLPHDGLRCADAGGKGHVVSTGSAPPWQVQQHPSAVQVLRSGSFRIDKYKLSSDNSKR